MKYALSLISIALLTGCGAGNTNEETAEVQEVAAPAESHNVLTDEEKSEGWKLLFDGESISEWRNYNKEGIGSAWKIDDESIALLGEEKDDWQIKDGGDIVTQSEYENFELSLEWRVSENGNSGIIYNVIESEDYPYPWLTGPEMQVLDNDGHPDAKIHMHRAGDLYDMIACSEETVKPAMEWNQVRLIKNDGHVEHWLNGVKVVEFELYTPEWDEMVANSKFKDYADFGKGKKGRICLQDHGDPVWFRNIKIREL